MHTAHTHGLRNTTICGSKCTSIAGIFPKLIVLLAFFGATNLQSIAQQSVSTYKIRKIMIDPGHGGHDPGAVGKSTYEKTICLGIGTRLGRYINQFLPEVEVLYTRDTDKFVALDERSALANSAKADLFISIHVNSLNATKVTGTSTWVMGLHMTEENLEVATRENSVIKLENDHQAKYEGFDPDSPESYIMFTLMQNVYMEKSLQLATKVESEFKNVGRHSRGVHQAGFMVLWKAAMPAILIETGFISNPADEKYLSSAAGQDELAVSIFRAFKKYKDDIESNTPSAQPEAKLTKTTGRKNEENPQKKVKNSEKSITFSLQLTTSPTPIATNSPIFGGLRDVFEQKQDGLYKYYIGKVAKYDDLKPIKQKASAKFPGTFAVAFEDGKRIDIKDALARTQ